VMFGHRWELGDLGVVRIDHIKPPSGGGKDGAPHGLLYPFEAALRETEWAATVEDRLAAVEETERLLKELREQLIANGLTPRG